MLNGSNFYIETDYVVMAIGSIVEKSIIKENQLEVNEYNFVKIDEQNRTNQKKVFAGGDFVGQKATVSWAARSGRNAAKAIIEEFETQM